MDCKDEQRLKLVLETDEPTDEQTAQWALQHINEDPDRKEQDICDLRDLIFERGEFLPHRTDDAFLIRFLRARYFNVEKAHRLMINYYTFKNDHPEYFRGMNYRRVREITSTSLICCPPYRDQYGRRMLIHRIGIWDPTQYTAEELIYVTVGIIETAIFEPVYQMKGGLFICDLQDLTLNHAWQMTPSLAQDIIQLVMKVIPFRLEAVHILNQPRVFDVAYNVMVRFLPSTITTNIHFHGNDMTSLHKHILPEFLPKRYGGIHLDYPVGAWFDEFVKKHDWMIQELIELGYEELEGLRKERDVQEE